MFFLLHYKDPGNEASVQIPKERICITKKGQRKSGPTRNGNNEEKSSDGSQSPNTCSSKGKMNQNGKSSQNKDGMMSNNMNSGSMEGADKPMMCDTVNIDESKLIKLMKSNP